MSGRSADEIKLDIDELESLLPQVKRQKSRDLLTLEIRKLQTELVNLKNSETAEKTAKPVASNTTSKCYTVKLTNYAWDESDNFMKLYITLKNVHSLSAEKIICDFKERSMHLRVNGLDNKNYELSISDLCEPVNPEKSYTKTKTDMIVVFLSKKSPKRWSHVTGIEKRMKEAKASGSELGDNSDPESSLMNMMKKLYQDGDDDMKRTIAKAWTESQEKKSAPGLDFPSL